MDVSIIICTYNRSALLANMLESLSKVRVPAGTRCELILVDNNSTDDTREAIESYSNRLPIIRRFEPVQGHAQSRNSAIEAATGAPARGVLLYV